MTNACLVFFLKYDLCATFEMAHYCTIKTGYLGPAGEFRLNQCVSKTCSASLIKDSLLNNIDRIVGIAKFFSSAQTGEEIKELADLVTANLTVDCMENERHLDSIGWTVVGIFVLLCALVFAATVVDVFTTRDSNSSPLLVGCFSAKHNLSRLMDASKGSEFDVFNGMRVLSMLWIIVGHTVLNCLSPMVKNLNAAQRFSQSYAFVWISGAEYCVDCFFFISGFLAMWIVLKELGKRDNTVRFSHYCVMLFSRWARLTPVYAFVLFWFWKVRPSMGWGPLWNEQFSDAGGAANSDMCDDSWWTNLLYINNFKPWNVPKCAAWTWYLANDMQFFLLVPFIAANSLYWRASHTSRSWAPFLRYGPCVLLVVVQIIATWLLFLSKDLTGAMLQPNYFGDVYEKPWTRVTPYAFGMMLAMVHSDRLQDKRSTASLRFHFGDAAFSAGLAALFGLISVRYFQFRCTDTQANCDAWFAIFFNGAFAYQNWSVATSAAFAALAWPAYSIALTFVSYSLLCGHDFLHIKWVLAHPRLVAPARLTFSAYLVHMPIMFMYSYSQPVIPTYTGWWLLAHGTAFFVLAYLAAFVLYMVVERPSMNLFTRLMTSRSRRVGASVALHADQQQQLLHHQHSVHSDDVGSETAVPLLGDAQAADGHQ